MCRQARHFVNSAADQWPRQRFIRNRPPAQHSNPGSGAPATAGLADNVAGALCYSLWWLTGIIFLVIDKRHSVRFHAAQSIVVFGRLITIIYWVIDAMFTTEYSVR